jgi:uncharacterized membrane protein
MNVLPIRCSPVKFGSGSHPAANFARAKFAFAQGLAYILTQEASSACLSGFVGLPLAKAVSLSKRANAWAT